jgi:hypothetical protein
MAYFKVLFTTMNLRNENTHKSYMVFDFVTYCDSLRQSITRHSERVQFLGSTISFSYCAGFCK